MILRTAPARRGFTLLEVLLASMLAALVLAGVYMMMNVTLQQTQAGRDAVEVEDLPRGVFNKMTNDLSGTLAPLPPKSGGNNAASGGASAPGSSSSASSSASSTSTGTSTTAAAGSGSSASAASASSPSATTTASGGSTDPSATDNSTAAAADYAFQGGVIGDEQKLIVFAGRVPEACGRYGEAGQVRSDQRQIIYWLGQNGGLYRRERAWVTADDVRMAADTDETATDSALLAEEVGALQFEYSDGTDWMPTWDGTTAGPDGVTPLGPPRAIRVTLTFKMRTGRGQAIEKQVSQVIAIRAAPGTFTPPLLEAATDGGDNAASGASSSSSGGTTGTTGANGSGASGATGASKSGGTTGSSMPSSGTGAKTGGTKGGGK